MFSNSGIHQTEYFFVRYYEFQRKEDGPELLSAVKGGTFM
jgi:hypothetical protein